MLDAQPLHLLQQIKHERRAGLPAPRDR